MPHSSSTWWRTDVHQDRRPFLLARNRVTRAVRAWFEAQWGRSAWDALDKIPRLQWMDYLRWYRRVTRADVRNEHAVTAVRPRADALVEVDVHTPTCSATWLARSSSTRSPGR